MGHEHGHHAASASGRHLRALALSFGLIAAFTAVEVVVGLAVGSLALLSDAGHMLTDVFGVGLALVTVLWVHRRTPSPRHTFGLYRAEVLAALANAVLLVGVAGFIVAEAVRRLADPPTVAGLPVLLTAGAGLIANLVAFLVLRAGSQESLNIRAACTEVISDTVGSAGVLLGGALTLVFGWRWVDPVVAIGVGLFILPRTIRLGAQALRILIQSTPGHLDPDEVSIALTQLDGVADAHDVHLWTLTSGMEVASVHLTAEPNTDPVTVLNLAQTLLADRFGLEHATVQVEPVNSGARCRVPHW
ncbi:MAG: cation transporter [Pseudonocardia sp.]|nr:cation transporter [Pseudonocardia sp.]